MSNTSSLEQSQQQYDHWELCKENAAPLARGRDVKKLCNALQTHTSAKDKEEDPNRRKFEILVRPSEKFAKLYTDHKDQLHADEQNHDDLHIKTALLEKCKVDKDPIIHWTKYIKYMEDTYPADTHSHFLLMERCTQALLNHPLYTDDVRYIRVCVLYADRTSSPQDTFKLLHKSKIGSNTAIFWLAWAWVAEKKKDYPFAEKIFLKALNKKAKPIKTVEERYKQFHRRMSRHWLNSAASNSEPSSDDYVDGEEQNYQHDNNNRRGALNGLSEEGIRQNVRARGANDMALFGRQNGNRPLFQDLTNNGTSSKTSNQIFSVYTEEADEGNNHYDLDKSTIEPDHNSTRPSRFIKEEDKCKENMIGAERWNERGGLHSNPSQHQSMQSHPNERIEHYEVAASIAQRWGGTDSHSRVAGGTALQPAFQVFVDEECATKHETESKDNMKKRPLGGGSERTLRQRLDPSMPPRYPLGFSGRPTAEHDDTSRYVSSASIKYQDDSDRKAIRSSQDNKKKLANESLLPTADIGFDKALISKDKDGQETCFEEWRMKRLYYNIITPDHNFNLLQQECTNDSYIDNEASCMDVDMTDQSKSLDLVNSTFGNNSVSMQNASTVSSTINEYDAVGFVGDKEETINTKFAARELSMMFSSPTTANQSSRKLLINSSMHKSSFKPLFTDDIKKSKIKASSGHDLKPTQSFAIFCDDNCDDNPNLPGSDKTVAKPISDFEIFCDEEKKECENTTRNDVIVTHNDNLKSKSKFEIFSDETCFQNDHRKSSAATNFTVYEDPDINSTNDDTDSPQRGNEDTVSLTDLNEILTDCKSIKESPRYKNTLNRLSNDNPNGKRKEAHAAEITIFCDDGDVLQNNGTVLTEDVARFGDLSVIAPNEIDLQESMHQLSFTDRKTRKPVDYRIRHDQDIKLARVNLLREAKKIKRNMTTAAKKVFDMSHTFLPNDLKKVLRNGAEIDIDGLVFVVNHELGKGSYGTVLLCSPLQSHSDKFALKVQTPEGSLAWEREILEKLTERISCNQENEMTKLPFPEVNSYVSFSDGGVLGMTAGSESGLNLVDVVNAHKVNSLTNKGTVPEKLAIYYTSRMLLQLETLHRKGNILHCDVKPDNWILTSLIEDENFRYNGLTGSDLMLVDFGRSIDLTKVRKDSTDLQGILLQGNVAAEDMGCVAMRLGLPWSYDIDTFGLCASAHVLLFGEYMDIDKDSTTNRWKIKKRLHRYWENTLWTNLFDKLLNLNTSGEGVDIGSYFRILRDIRLSFETYLDKGSNRQEVYSLLNTQKSILPKVRSK